jgi:nucleotide-binding universal stress UspA family protein
MISIRNILYATDFSSYSNQAYFHAVALAEKYDARLIILHVAGPSDNGNRENWREHLEQIRPVNSSIPVRHVLLVGEPADEILRFAKESQVDLIVVGTHGRTGLERLLMGSIAEKVLRGATCSVLIVKMPKPVATTERIEEASESASAPVTGI